VRISSITGKAILKIIVRIITEPILLYQSAVKSPYRPCNKKPTSLGAVPPEYFMFSIIMIRAEFMIKRKALFKVYEYNSEATRRWL
jgi:hypothetical protein